MMLSERTQEALMIACADATDDKGCPVYIPLYSIFTNECLIRDFGWTQAQVDTFRAQ